MIVSSLYKEFWDSESTKLGRLMTHNCVLSHDTSCQTVGQTEKGFEAKELGFLLQLLWTCV